MRRGGVFDNTTPRQNKKGWDIFELGQKSFWAVPTAVAVVLDGRAEPLWGGTVLGLSSPVDVTLSR